MKYLRQAKDFFLSNHRRIFNYLKSDKEITIQSVKIGGLKDSKIQISYKDDDFIICIDGRDQLSVRKGEVQSVWIYNTSYDLLFARLETDL